MIMECREQVAREQQAAASPLQPRRPHLAQMSVPASDPAETYAEVSNDEMLDLESDLMADHRQHIEAHMRLVRLEMNMLSQVGLLW